MSNSNASWRRYAGAAARQLRLRGGATDGNSQVTALQRVAAERAAFEASLFSGIAHGEGLGDAVVRIARESSITKSRGSSRGFLQRLIDDPMGAPAGRLGFAVFLTRDALYESASVWFARAGEDIAIQFAAPEYVDTLFSTDESGHAESVATDLVAAGDSNEPLERLRLAKVLAKHRSLDLLETALAGLAADPPALAALSEDEREEITWMGNLLSNVREPAQSIEGAVNIAVMDYKLLDKGRTSSNRGDYVQTLAAVSHLLRFTDVEFVGGGKLASYLEGLKGEVHADRTIPGVATKVLPVPLDRDFASGRAYPKDTWLICNGWFMHRAFKGRVDFPFPEEVNPIMISFHIQEPDVLSEDVVEALREYQPIGCRDWTTVYRLRDVGISAFFSGCVTTTVGQVLKSANPSGTHRLADVEGRLRTVDYPSWRRETFIQIGPQVRDFDLVEGIEDAREMLNEYAPFNKVATLRLHCYLPARSMGLPVDFRPRNRADVRFEGLLDLTDEAFSAIRGGIESKLEVMLREILSGASREEVYATWRRITADDVVAAEEYCNNYPDHVPSAINVPDSVAKITATKLTMGEMAPADAVNLAFALDKNLTEQFAVVLQSLVDHTSRPLLCHVLGRGLGHAYYERLHALFPQIQFDFYDLSGITYGEDVALLSHISVSTMDRLFLPELLPDCDKVVYLDIDILLQADVGELFDIELGDNVVAAKRTRLKTWANLVRPITRGSLHLPPEEAWLMRRRIHGVGKLTTRTFNAGVLVLNLGLMRADRFTAENLYLVEKCWLNDQDVLNVYCRDRVHELDPSWNTVPSQDSELDPRIIHWAGPTKPWKSEHVLFGNRYAETAELVSKRTKALAR